jgi:hypothetical protein
MAGVQVAGPAKQTLPGRVVLNVMQDNVPSQAVLIAWNMLQGPTLGIGSWIDQLSDPQLEGLSTRRTRLPCLSRVARAAPWPVKVKTTRRPSSASDLRTASRARTSATSGATAGIPESRGSVDLSYHANVGDRQLPKQVR